MQYAFRLLLRNVMSANGNGTWSHLKKHTSNKWKTFSMKIGDNVVADNTNVNVHKELRCGSLNSCRPYTFNLISILEVPQSNSRFFTLYSDWIVSGWLYVSTKVSLIRFTITTVHHSQIWPSETEVSRTPGWPHIACLSITFTSNSKQCELVISPEMAYFCRIHSFTPRFTARWSIKGQRQQAGGVANTTLWCHSSISSRYCGHQPVTQCV